MHSILFLLKEIEIIFWGSLEFSVLAGLLVFLPWVILAGLVYLVSFLSDKIFEQFQKRRQ